jgi:hypothetical protein
MRKGWKFGGAWLDILAVCRSWCRTDMLGVHKWFECEWSVRYKLYIAHCELRDLGTFPVQLQIQIHTSKEEEKNATESTPRANR